VPEFSVKRFFKIFLVYISLTALCACSVTRVSTTEHTAVEEALLSEALIKATESLETKNATGKSFFVKEIETVEGKVTFSDKESEGKAHTLDKYYVKLAVTEHLLSIGGKLASSEKEADLIVFTQVHTGSIDDSEFAFGVPSIPVPVPGVGTVETPALNLFERHSQYGRAKITVFAVENNSGELAFSLTSDSDGKYYSRWGLFFIIGWRTTDLGEPH